MTENGPTGTTSEPLTVWERRTASFQDALSSGWRSYRLVPWLFKHAGRVEPVELTPEAFGGAELYATTDFSLERGYGLDGMAKEWGASIARGETAALTAKLGEQCSIEPTNDAIRHELYEVLSRIGNDDTVAILAPSRGRLLRALELGPPEDLPWLPGVGARSLLRGTFEGIAFSRPNRQTRLISGSSTSLASPGGNTLGRSMTSRRTQICDAIGSPRLTEVGT